MIRRGVIAALVMAAFSPAVFAAGPFGGDQSGIPMTSSVFRAWISGVVDVQHPVAGSGGFANDDNADPTDPTNAVVGVPSDDLNNAHVFSLGDGGSIVVKFDEAVYDGPGADFAVFENGFTDGTPRSGDTNKYTFAELAFVEVGTTSNAWARFPSQYLGTNALYNFDRPASNFWASQDVTLIDGLAGKHAVQFGTPFDLASLRADANVLNGSVDLQCIRFVRLIDVVGDGTTFDSSNRPIYDPCFNFLTGWPNPEPVSAVDGFDLRAIGLINSGELFSRPAASTSGGMVLSWFAATNSTWHLQCATTPAGPWSNVVSIAGIDAAIAITNRADGGSAFYRLQRTPLP
jgi:hypothetical protein